MLFLGYNLPTTNAYKANRKTLQIRLVCLF